MTIERALLAILTVAVTVLLLREFQFQVGLEHMVSMAILAVAGWIVYGGYRAYKGSTGQWRQRLFAAFSYSQTLIATRAQYAIGMVLVFSEWVATVLNEPTVASALQQYASPKVSGGLLIGSAIITEACRRRKSSLDPVLPPVTAPVTGPTGTTGA